MGIDNRLRISWLVVIAAIVGILAGIGVSIMNLCHSKKEKLILETNSKIVRSLYDLNAISTQDSVVVSANSSCTMFSIIKNGVIKDYPIRVEDVVDVQYKAMYEIRDTAKWTLNALYTLFCEKMGMEKEDMPVKFSVTDSTGCVLDSLNIGYVSPWFRIEAKPVALGLLEKRILKMELMFPLRQFWEESRDMFILLGGILVWMVACIMVLIFTLRRERERSVGQHLFVDTVVHNLRSPLDFITMAQGIILQKYAFGMEEKHVQLLEGIQERGRDMERAINRLLTLSDVLHRIVIYPQEVDLRMMLEKFKTLGFVKIPTGKNVRFTVRCDMQDPVIWADAVYLPVVFENLIGNAIKYSGDEVSIDMVCQEDGAWVMIRVKDNGMGISQNGLKHIFEVYYREPVVREDKGKRGFGVGLSFVYSAVKAHDGKIRVKSTLGAGTEFVIILPRKSWKKKWMFCTRRMIRKWRN